MNSHHIAKKFLAKPPVIHHFGHQQSKSHFTFTDFLKKYNITEHYREKMCNFIPNIQQFI